MRLAVVVWLIVAMPAFALEPRDVIIIANRAMPESLEVAQHYQKQRGIPGENLFSFELPKTEDISRADYDQKLAEPLRKALAERKDQVKVLLCVYGVPLRVGGDSPTGEESDELKLLNPRIATAQQEVNRLRDELTSLEAEAKETPPGVMAATIRERRLELTTAENGLRGMERKRGWLNHHESLASVDSELMLLWWDKYELRRWIMNPLYFNAPNSEKKQLTMMTCRLDGPTPAIAKRLVDDSIAVEKEGLKGKVYVDARGIGFDPKTDLMGTGYGGYDESMREMARLLEKEGKMTVILDDRNELFAPASCTDCAMYCGWYSHANFIDCCRFVKGAVAWHLASSEAVSLRRADAKYWCKNLLENGAVATLGPVSEPYTVGFPKPEEFFGLLATGKYTLVECYAKTVMLSSWMGTLIGDPLYNPFAKNPRVKEEAVHPSPINARRFGR